MARCDGGQAFELTVAIGSAADVDGQAPLAAADARERKSSPAARPIRAPRKCVRSPVLGPPNAARAVSVFTHATNCLSEPAGICDPTASPKS
jgi:hypothetical protein